MPDPHKNHFDSLRLIAAVAVLAAHSVPLSYGPGALDFLWAFSAGRATIGSVAVEVFFIISGYLITGSYLARPQPRRYLQARFLRLAPGLLVVLFLLAFGLGPVITKVPLQQYFSSPLPYRAELGLSDHLPGVFEKNPFSSGIDGSLWTLRYEALCYMAVLALGLAGWLRRTAVTGLFLLLLALRLHFGGALADFSALFAAGAVLQFWRPPLNVPAAWACAALWVLSLRFGLTTLVADTLGAYLVIHLALSPAIKLPDLAKYGDLSYGVYIYAWPVQQLIAQCSGSHANWAVNIIIALPVVLTLAALSWHFVEAPSLRLKNKKLLGVL